MLKLREEGAFLEHAERFEQPVLAYDVDLPASLVPAGTDAVDVYTGQVTPWQHVALMRHQFGLLRNALAIAHVL